MARERRRVSAKKGARERSEVLHFGIHEYMREGVRWEDIFSVGLSPNGYVDIGTLGVGQPLG